MDTAYCSFIPRPHPAFCRFQYCKTSAWQKAGRDLGTRLSILIWSCCVCRSKFDKHRGISFFRSSWKRHKNTLLYTIATKILSVTTVHVAATLNAVHYYMPEVLGRYGIYRLRWGSSRSLCLSFGFVWGLLVLPTCLHLFTLKCYLEEEVHHSTVTMKGNNTA